MSHAKPSLPAAAASSPAPLSLRRPWRPALAVAAVAALVAACQPAPQDQQAVAARIQKVGVVDIRVSQADRPLATGEEVYKAQCAACHATGVTGAPKFADAGDWAPRLGQGAEALLNSALKGKNAMPPQGGGNFRDLEIHRAVVYMANHAGGKLEEPPAPAEGEAKPADGASAAAPAA